MAPADCFPAGRLGGSEGVGGGGGFSKTAAVGVDLELLNGILDFSISSYLFSISALVRLGGRAGNVEGSKTGGTLLPDSIEGVLEDVVLDVPFDSADIDGALDPDVLAVSFDNAEIDEIDDIFDVNDDTDSAESRRVSWCSVGLLGGKAGEAWVDRSRGGSLGGGGGFVCCGTA